MSDNRVTELQGILDEFEHECFMLRVEASETRARDDVVRNSYERIRDEFAERIAATFGNGTCEMITSGAACKGNTDKRCTACGAYGIGEHYDGDEHIATPKFCPECGAKVVGR